MAMNGDRVVSSRFPYLPLRLTIGGHTERLEALLDTGFDGDVVVPSGYLGDRPEPADHLPGRLADGSEVIMPAYVGSMQIGAREVTPVTVLALGDIPIVGVNLIRYFMVMLDHGRRVIVEP